MCLGAIQVQIGAIRMLLLLSKWRKNGRASREAQRARVIGSSENDEIRNWAAGAEMVSERNKCELYVLSGLTAPT